VGVDAFPIAGHAPANPPLGTFRFDAKRAQRAIDFFEKILVHTKGRYAGTPFILEPWQKEIVTRIFGTVAYDEQHEEWIRQYRLAWIELARKNGKSELLSGFALLGLCADDEESAEVYSVAVDRDQAGMVYMVAKRMVELSPILSKRLEVVDSRKRIIDKKTNSFYQVLPGDAGGALGTNPSMVLFDEVLTQRDRHLWDAMRQGFGTRKQPIMIAATTAAYTTAAFALEEHEYGERVIADPSIDPARYVFMRNLPREWDWENEGTPAVYDGDTLVTPATGWYWANPALGSFLSLGTLRAEAQEAKEKPTAQNSFRVFRLNQWVSQANRWLDMSVYDANGELDVFRESLAGFAAFGGLDLASTSDFCSWVLAFPGSPEDESAEGFTILPHFFIPRSAVERRAPMKTHFELWEREGFITVTEGNSTDYDEIERHIGRDAETFIVRAFGYDQWNATQVVGHLEDGGLTAVKVPQTAARLNDPCKWMETLIADRHFYHGRNPVLRWMMDNVELDVTGDGLVKPSKAKSGEKIDGVAATLNALFVARLGVELEETPEVKFIPFVEDDSADSEGRPKDEIDRVLALLTGGDDRRNYFDDDDD
jgi:phage terminase large subunit-like protein